MRPILFHTIAAISTPPGEGGIGIVRISGEDAFNIIHRIFLANKEIDWNQIPSHTMHYGWIVDASGSAVDEVLVSLMKGPHTFTTEDVAEVNCHGGMVPLRKTLELIIAAGARLAEPGEFSKRAFLNGRIDLSQAESIIDVIRAKTEAGLTASVGQLRGRLSAKIGELRHELLGILAVIEASIDFPEDEVDEITAVQVKKRVALVLTGLDELIRSADRGKILREGIRTAIVGRTNVGKSSLLNALLGENRAIVTEVPGTTRDTIEEYINVGGIPLQIIDTAGIRDTEDPVEKIGVQKSRDLFEAADLVLVVLDLARDIEDEDLQLIAAARGKNSIVLLNKMDIAVDPTKIGKYEKLLEGIPHVSVSAKEETGLDQLERIIADLVLESGVEISRDLLVTSLRHKECLFRAAGFLREVLSAAAAGVSLDILSIDLKAAWEALGEINGDTVGEDLLDRIFSEFCIGK